MPGTLRNMQIVIRGANFDPVTPTNNVVTFNGVEAPIFGVTAVEIRTEVPVGATSGPVKVTVAGQASNSIDFVVTSNYANAVVAEDVRFGREWLPDLLQAILGAPDHDGPAGTGTPATDIGIGIGGSIVVDLGEGQSSCVLVKDEKYGPKDEMQTMPFGTREIEEALEKCTNPDGLCSGDLKKESGLTHGTYIRARKRLEFNDVIVRKEKGRKVFWRLKNGKDKNAVYLE